MVSVKLLLVVVVVVVVVLVVQKEVLWLYLPLPSHRKFGSTKYMGNSDLIINLMYVITDLSNF
jgi:hypothetical protein